MRPLPVERVDASPAFVLGLAMIRGDAVPVVDTARLLTGEPGMPGRFIALRVGERRVALAVAEVIGTRMITLDDFERVPPLFAAPSSVTRALGALDGQLLQILEGARLIDSALSDTAGAVITR
jgi:purine-binding chemotaxis protein CheW